MREMLDGGIKSWLLPKKKRKSAVFFRLHIFLKVPEFYGVADGSEVSGAAFTKYRKGFNRK